MKVVLAFDKFKGSATARELSDAACQALEGIVGVTVACVPVADGGDGTTAVLADCCQGQWITVPTTAPLLQQNLVNAQYFITDDATALIEVAAASGLARVPEGQRNVMRATTLGTGMLMRDAMEHGCRHIVLGLGGSATCDAAMGIMCALGAEFHDEHGHYLFPCGESIGEIAHIETLGIPPEVHECRFTLNSAEHFKEFHRHETYARPSCKQNPMRTNATGGMKKCYISSVATQFRIWATKPLNTQQTNTKNTSNAH